MKNEFWLKRWEREETGFHQGDINPYLRRYWPELNLDGDRTVFVPLCGKSLDILWLRDQGHPVVGVELSAIAVRAFFAENRYMPQHQAQEKFDRCEAGGIRILCGDLFDLGSDDLKDAAAVYDRASLIAFPPEMRERYVRHLAGILPPATQILLVTVDYPQAEMQGPPFSVPAAEVEVLFRDHAVVRMLSQADVLAQNPRFQQRGLSRLRENIFLLTLHGRQ